MSKQLEELTEEIRKLRKEVRELRDLGGTHIHHHYAPIPAYVPQYPQPSYVPWWYTVTSAAIPWGTTLESGVINNAVVPAALPATTQISPT